MVSESFRLTVCFELPPTGDVKPALPSHQVPESSGIRLATEPETPLAKVSARSVAGSFNTTEPGGDRMLKVYSNGTIRFKDVAYSLTIRLAHRQMTITWDPEAIAFVAIEGEIIAEFG